MVYSVDIDERKRAVPAWRGVFYADEVARWLSATDAHIRGERIELGPHSVIGWSRQGFFGLERNEYDRHREYIRFGDVITSRVIALLLSYGIGIGAILEAHDYLRDAAGLEFPFASRRFWVESDAFPDEVCSMLDELLVTASRHGRLPLTELIYERIGDPGDMEFEDTESGYATRWVPMPGVFIDPDYQTGAACLAGTRTPTYVLYGGYVAGEDVESLAYWYELDEEQVTTAIEWEKRLAAA